MGGLAERCVADRARNPAGPSAPLAVTIATPIALHPIAFQKVFASISLSMPGTPLLSGHLMRKECRLAVRGCRARRRLHRPVSTPVEGDAGQGQDQGTSGILVRRNSRLFCTILGWALRL